MVAIIAARNLVVEWFWLQVQTRVLAKVVAYGNRECDKDWTMSFKGDHAAFHALQEFGCCSLAVMKNMQPLSNLFSRVVFHLTKKLCLLFVGLTNPKKSKPQGTWNKENYVRD